MKVLLADGLPVPEIVPWRKVAKFAKKHPGEWVTPERVVNGGYATMIRGGQIVAFRPRENWEARVINSRVCIRYVGNRG